MTLSANFTSSRGALRLQIKLEAGVDETVAVVGPNGAGKSSCLQALAGLLPIDDGHIMVEGETLDGGPNGPFVPAPARGVGFVFQDQRLFPHLTSLENVAYGLRARGRPRPKAQREAHNWLQRVGMGDFLGVRPSALSGGQAQRVALARALAATPRLLLLDEPLSAVDASARVELRRELRAHLDAFHGVRIVVVHDALEAFALADRIAVLETGRVVQIGSAAELCRQPRSPYVADLIGLNFFRGRSEGGRFTTSSGGQLVIASSPNGPVFATLHPRAVSLFRERPDGSPRNVWQAPIDSIETAVDRLRVHIAGALPLVAEVTPAAMADLNLRAGDRIWVAVKATEIGVEPLIASSC